MYALGEAGCDGAGRITECAVFAAQSDLIRGRAGDGGTGDERRAARARERDCEVAGEQGEAAGSAGVVAVELQSAAGS